jgi:hypothetical protein
MKYSQVLGAPEAAARSGEREHGQWHGNGNINANLSNINFVDKFPRSRTIRRENGGAIAVWVFIDEVDGVVERLGRETHQHWSKNLLLVAFHRGRHVDENGGTNKVALVEAIDLDVAAVEHDFGAFINSRLHQVKDAFLRLRRDDWADIDAWFVSGSDLQLRCTLNQIWNPFASLAHKDCGRERHATLTGCAKSGTRQLVQRGILVGIGHDYAMILRAHVALHALAIAAATLVDVLASLVGAHERNRADVWVVADEIDRVVRTMNDVNYTRWATRLIEHLAEQQRRAWIALARLDDARVAARNCNWKPFFAREKRDFQVEKRDSVREVNYVRS